MKTICTCSPYSCSICVRVGPTLEQKGHWKSEDSTSLTFALSGPLAGEPEVFTL